MWVVCGASALLDSRGIIRYRDVFDRELNTAIDALLKEMERTCPVK
jgi:hypothetical protein